MLSKAEGEMLADKLLDVQEVCSRTCRVLKHSSLLRRPEYPKQRRRARRRLLGGISGVVWDQIGLLGPVRWVATWRRRCALRRLRCRTREVRLQTKGPGEMEGCNFRAAMICIHIDTQIFFAMYKLRLSKILAKPGLLAR